MWLDHLRQDVRGAARSMAKYPVACAVAVLSLAGGIGSTTATLTVRNTVFRNPPPLYQQPAQLSRVTVGAPDRPCGLVAGTLFKTWFEDIALRSRMRST